MRLKTGDMGDVTDCRRKRLELHTDRRSTITGMRTPAATQTQSVVIHMSRIAPGDVADTLKKQADQTAPPHTKYA